MQNDPDRLAALRATALVDQAPSQMLDALTRMATQLLGAPVSLVTLLDDDRQWFAGLAGLSGLIAEQRSTPLSYSLCQHVVAQRAPFVVDDTTQHALTADNLAVTDMGVRAYAGVPLTTRGGVTLGAFCALDMAPRHWSPADVEILEGLAQAALSEIELRLTLDAERRLASQLRSIISAATDSILVTDAAERIVLANEAAERMFGVPVESLVRQSLDAIVPERTGGSTSWIARRHDGHAFHVEASASRIETPDGVLQTVILRDVTERVAATQELDHAIEALRESERRARLLFRDSPLPLWVFDLETLRVLDVNAAAMERYGYSHAEFTALTIHELRPTSDRGALEDVLTRRWDGLAHIGLYRHQSKSGAIFDVEVSSQHTEYAGRPARIVLAKDVTEQRQLEEQLRQAQKMEAVGQLAGGVAHDFNNLLTVITGNLEFVRQDLPTGHVVLRDLDEIGRAAERARALVRQLLTFSRKQPALLQDVRLRDVIERAEGLLRRVIGAEILLHVDAGGADVHVRADTGQLEQVLMNLAVNARDAMMTPLHGRVVSGGTLTITIDHVDLAPSEARRWDGVSPGRWARLVVRDTGHGMDAETRAHAFEPFFTTKAIGVGTGLGLATVFGIVRQSGGVIRVDSAPGAGTTFTILLPAVDAPAADGVPVYSGEHALPVIGTVLFVEDETPVRVTTRRMLERRGYTVLEARHGADALLLWREHGPSIDAVITDLRMPEMAGQELVAHLRADRPGVPVVFVSGYTEDELLVTSDRHECFVQKPFTGEELLRALARVLPA